MIQSSSMSQERVVCKSIMKDKEKEDKEKEDKEDKDKEEKKKMELNKLMNDIKLIFRTMKKYQSYTSIMNERYEQNARHIRNLTSEFRSFKYSVVLGIFVFVTTMIIFK